MCVCVTSIFKLCHGIRIYTFEGSRYIPAFCAINSFVVINKRIINHYAKIFMLERCIFMLEKLNKLLNNVMTSIRKQTTNVDICKAMTFFFITSQTKYYK